MQEISESVIHSVIMSEDGRYRFKLNRCWDEKKKNATVIMLNPSKANLLKSDMTITNIINFLIDKDYGSLTVVNLFPYMATDPKDLKSHKHEFLEKNDEFINNSCKETDIVIIGWTRGENVNRKKEVENILKKFKDKIYAFQDPLGKFPCHPRNITTNWTIVKYFN